MSTSEAPVDAVLMDRVAGALWGLYIADALASPTHWFYGGASQVKRSYGGGISGYVKPNFECEGSIMNKSDTGGAGRGKYQGDIIGSIINHGKKHYWQPGRSIHYHCTLDAGENTLEATLVRVLVRCIAANGGKFDAELFRTEYVKFMTCAQRLRAERANALTPEDTPTADRGACRAFAARSSRPWAVSGWRL